FLAHVLPRGFPKVRSYGLLSPGRRSELDLARHILTTHSTGAPTPVVATSTVSSPAPGACGGSGPSEPAGTAGIAVVLVVLSPAPPRTVPSSRAHSRPSSTLRHD